MNAISETISFISVRGDQFTLNNRSYDSLQGMIQKAQPIRKFFLQGKLHCYSMDAQQSHVSKQYCVFCDDAYRCQRKLRLSIMLILGDSLLPAVLDINQRSISDYQQLLDSMAPEEMQNTIISMKIVTDEDDNSIIEFTKN